MREARDNKPVIKHMCFSCGKGVPVNQKNHICSSSDLDIIKNMLQSIPEPLKPKLAHSLLKQIKEGQKEDNGPLLPRKESQTVHLPPANGGPPLAVYIGAQQHGTSSLEPLTHKEVVQISSRHYLSGEQQAGIMSDIRAKWGRQIVEPKLKESMHGYNNQFAPYFTEDEKQFVDSEDNILPKHLFYCHNPVSFVLELDRLRGVDSANMENIIQGDTGQNYLKLGLNHIKKSDLESKIENHIPSAGFEFKQEQMNEHSDEDGEPSKKKVKRRTREEGISGAPQFRDWGARKMMLLPVVYKVPENHHNLSIIFDVVGVNQIPFKLTVDFAFLMPILGLIKGCAASNPCPICDQRKTTAGGGGPRWVGDDTDISLQTLGSLYSNYAGWVTEGEKTTAAATRKWKSVCGSPLLSMSQGRLYTDFILKMLVPGPLHLFLSWNEIVNFLEKTLWPDIKMVLKNVMGIQFHVYMGKVGNYEGPSIHKVFRYLHKLEPYMLGGSNMRLYYATFVAFKDVSHYVFSQDNLHPDWREKLHHLRSCILALNSR